MLKADIRRVYLKKRKLFSDTEIENFSKLISDHFFNSFEPNNETIHCFLPISNQNEINTKIIIDRLFLETNCTVVTSKSNFKTLEMEHFIINANTNFKEDKYGIPTPINGEKINVINIDWILTPLICFDKNGYRVGYGKGFYDRFISQCKPNVKTIGLSIFDALDKILDTNKFDKPITHCITPKTTYYFKQ